MKKFSKFLNEIKVGTWSSPKKLGSPDSGERHWHPIIGAKPHEQQGHWLNRPYNPNKPTKVLDKSTVHHSIAAQEHEKSFSKEHHAAIQSYKNESDKINTPLRKGLKNSNPQVKHLDHVTGNKHPYGFKAYRSVEPKMFGKLKPGHEFTDHGYTELSHNSNIAAEFADNHPKSDKPVIARIHVPSGTRGHFLDHNHASTHLGDADHEKGHLLHRGTKFRVLGHSENDDHHIVHMKVVGQEHHK